MKKVTEKLICLLFLLSWVKAHRLVGECESDQECKPLDQCPYENGLPQAELYKLRFCGYLLVHTLVCCRKEVKVARRLGKAIDLKSHKNINLINNPTVCGVSLAYRVSNGKVAAINQFPWLVLLEYRTSDGEKSFNCGGSLISNQYVLTAAHCRSRENLILISVRLGDYSISKELDCFSPTHCNPPPENIPIESFIEHEEYNSTSKLNDIALIRLSHQVILSNEKPHVRTICLPVDDFHQIDSPDKNANDKKLTVAGWGQTEDALKSDVPKFAYLNYESNEECIKNLEEKKKQSINRFIKSDIRETQMCAGGSVAADACKGDSGSVLSGLSRWKMNKLHRSFQYGIVSFGVNCRATEPFPGVFTRVSSYVDWILNNMTN